MDTVIDCGGVRTQLVAADAVHVARRVPATSDQINGCTVQGVRIRPHDGHVNDVHQSTALRLAEHQLPAGHLGNMPADVVLWRPETATETQAVPIGGDGLPRSQRPTAWAWIRGAVQETSSTRRRDHRAVDRGQK